MREFIDYAKANRGSVTFASTGIGASPHLSGELFKRMAGIEMTHVPYRGAGPAMNDLLPGRVSVMFSNLPGVMPQVQSKTVRGLGITSAKRIAAAPDIPTIGETVPGYEVSTWWGVFAPARTPADVIEKIHADTVAALGPRIRQGALRSARRPAEPIDAGRACGVAAGAMPRNGRRSSRTPASSRSSGVLVEPIGGPDR